MTRVRLLPDTVASQVAAGEVVERPASILKELLENSLDAGARQIEVEWMRGGSGLIRVQDDGSGMNREDALLSLERHATSKIRTGEDLARIMTFGFRGEALPSIASVSRFRLVTKTRDSEDPATEILVDGGKVREVRHCGGPPGTNIEVRSLFFNLPARRKFLRTELTESGHLLHGFQTVALAHPEIGFLLRKDGRTIHQLAPTDDLRVRVHDLFGEDWLEQLVEPPATESRGIRVTGLVSRPGFMRLDRSGQFFFLNRRPVSDAAIARGLRAAGVEQGGRGGGHMSGILFLEMDPGRFDCNVHPSKREVRFQRPDEISTAVEAFVRSAQSSREKRNEHSNPEAVAGLQHLPGISGVAFQRTDVSLAELKSKPMEPELPISDSGTPALPGENQEAAHLPTNQPPEVTRIGSPPALGAGDEQQVECTPAPIAPAHPTPDFRLLGCLGKKYLLWESAEGMVLLEIRNALERIFYEEGSRLRQRAPAQNLLPPLVLTMDARDAAWAVENASVLAEFGLHLEAFGPNTVKVEALPAGLDEWGPEEVLMRLVDDLRAGSRSAARRFLQDELALSLATIKASRYSLAFGEERPLLARLFACEMPYVSPSGKPILLQTSWRELERKFTPGPLAVQ
jgi:DNA mismatch repair protein MutL